MENLDQRLTSLQTRYKWVSKIGIGSVFAYAVFSEKFPNILSPKTIMMFLLFGLFFQLMDNNLLRQEIIKLQQRMEANEKS
jgi:hypothetical protein